MTVHVRSAEGPQQDLGGVSRSTDAATASGFAFIGAVHRLLSSDRASSKTDLLLAAVTHALYESDRAPAQILDRVNDIWPGVNASEEDIRNALALGAELRLLASAHDLEGGEIWTLTKTGVQDVLQHESWVEDLRRRSVDALIEKAATGLQFTLDAETAELWLDRLVRALATGIQASQAVYLGQVEAMIGGRIVPRSIDKDKVLSALGSDTDEDPVVQFLRAVGVAALDPLDPFGNELVSHITTGCVLHAYVAGLDRQQILKRIGTPAGERAVLDTPILLELIGPKRLAPKVERTIRAAIEAGWEVIVLEHSLTELVEVLRRDIPDIQESLRRAHKRGLRAEWYAALVDEQLPSLCVEAVRDGTYGNLHAIVAAGEGLADRLLELGVAVRPHYNDRDSSCVDRLREALKTQLEGGKPRSATVIQRDADSMAVAWRRRRRQSGSKWPGAWIITSDRAMAPAYASVTTRDTVSLTLTMAQWTTVLSISASPLTVEQLAEVAAGQLVEEAMWLLPARFPSGVALDLAQQLSPDRGGSDTDMRVAQLTLDDVFMESDVVATPSSMASTVLSARMLRVNQLSQRHADRAKHELAQERQRASEAQLLAAEARAEKNAVQMDVGDLRAANAQQASDLQWKRTQLRRGAVSTALSVVGVAALTASFFTASLRTTLVLGVGLVVLVGASARWCLKREEGLTGLLTGAVLELVGGVSAGADLLDRF